MLACLLVAWVFTGILFVREPAFFGSMAYYLLPIDPEQNTHDVAKHSKYRSFRIERSFWGPNRETSTAIKH